MVVNLWLQKLFFKRPLYLDYWVPAKWVFCGTRDNLFEKPSIQLFELLSLTPETEVTDDLLRTLRALGGPHGYTIYKIIEARKAGSDPLSVTPSEQS
jgi:hypothetical protein